MVFGGPLPLYCTPVLELMTCGITPKSVLVAFLYLGLHPPSIATLIAWLFTSCTALRQGLKFGTMSKTLVRTEDSAGSSYTFDHCTMRSSLLS